MVYKTIMYKPVRYKKSASMEEGSAYLANYKENKPEESIRWKDPRPTLSKLEDTLAEVQDQLLEVNLGVGQEMQSIYIS